MKTRILFIFFYVVFTLQNINSQNELYREIQNKKETIAFQQISPFQVSKENNTSLLNQFKDKISFFRKYEECGESYQHGDSFGCR